MPMKKSFYIACLSLLIFSCAKKSESPQPEQQQIQVAPQKPDPYYRRIMSASHECCPENNNGTSQYERYQGHDDSHSPKADVWLVTQVYYRPSQNINDTTSVEKVLIWWENGTPHSDKYTFKFDSAINDWYRTWNTQVNVSGNIWFKYEVI